MKKLLNILGISSILGVSLVNLQNYKGLNIISKLNIDHNKNSSNYFYDLKRTSIFKKHVYDKSTTHNYYLSFINYGLAGYKTLDSYDSGHGHNQNITDKKFEIKSSIGGSWTQYNLALRSTLWISSLMTTYNKNVVMTNISYSKHGDYHKKSVAEVDMRLIDDTDKRIVYIEFTSITQNNNSWYNVYNEVRI